MARSYRGWLIVIALVGAMVDQASKYVVFGWLHNHPTHYNQATGTGSYELVPHAFSLHVQYTDERPSFWLQTWSSPNELPRVNQGALFGLGNEHAIAANYFFALVSVIAGIAIVSFVFLRPATSARPLAVCVAGPDPRRDDGKSVRPRRLPGRARLPLLLLSGELAGV